MDETWSFWDVSGNLTATLCLATVLLVVALRYLSKHHWADDWTKYGVKQTSFGKKAFEDFRQAYHQLIAENGHTVGVSGGKMLLFTTDLELLRMVMVKDFNSFADRDVAFMTKSNVEKGLFFLGGHDWKRVRHVISPSFSSGKIKSFVSTINQSATKLTKAIEDHIRAEKPVAIKDLAGQYTSEIIARLAFGLQTDCIGKEDDEFTHYAKKMFKVRSTLVTAFIIFLFRFPRLFKFLVKTLKIQFFDGVNQDADVYFNSVLHRTIAERREFVRSGKKLQNDFLQNLVVAKEEGDKAAVSSASAAEKVSQEAADKTMTDEELIGQAMLIIFAGFDTTSTTLQFCLYLLAKHLDVQEKLYEEVSRVVQSEVPTYEELGQLKYMEQVIYETLRMFPPAPLMTRMALETKTYGNVTIPKGAVVFILLDLIMMDPKHYEDPEKFDPDRFTEENKAKRDPMSFVPFGYGPRLCIGMRVALLELKIGLVNLIRKVRFDMDERMKNEKLNISFQGFIVLDKPIILTPRLRY